MPTHTIKREVARTVVTDAHGSRSQVVTYQEQVVVPPSLDNSPGEEIPQFTWHDDMSRNRLARKSEAEFLNEKTGEVFTKV